jgi:hypothetical protein
MLGTLWSQGVPGKHQDMVLSAYVIGYLLLQKLIDVIGYVTLFTCLGNVFLVMQINYFVTIICSMSYRNMNSFLMNFFHNPCLEKHNLVLTPPPKKKY